jgi:glycogen(starch) synthase
LIDIGGFDEEFEYFLDETDVCLRLVDAGYFIRQLDCAYVHHKYLPSTVRNDKRVVKHRYPVLKNKVYFSLKHARDYFPVERIFREQERFIANNRYDVQWCLDNNLLTLADVAAFEQDIEKAVSDGRTKGFQKPGPMITEASRAALAGHFTPFPTLSMNGDGLNIVLVTQDYPPNHDGGIATFNRDLATALAALGHQVYVVCQSPDINRVDFEAGVWVHRIVPQTVALSEAARHWQIPAHIWNWSASALGEVRRIAGHRPIDVVEAPIWDCQGIAFLLEGAWPLVTSLQTSLRFYLNYHSELLDDQKWMTSFGRPMLSAEQELMEKANAIRSISQAIQHDIERTYSFRFAEDQVVVAPLGLADVAPTPKESPTAAVNQGRELTILFVGRLEHRKGIDILLKAIPLVLAEQPGLCFRIIGDDSLPGPSGQTYRAAFERSPTGRRYAVQVRFNGKVDERTLNDAYAACDIFVSPSRYESFGLIFLEAMRQSKPVIGCPIGGMPEIIVPEVTGLLVPPDDALALATAILRLAGSAELRRKWGQQGRALFEEKFTDRRMAENSLPLYALAKRRPPFHHRLKISYVNGVCVKNDAISNAVRDEILALRQRGYSDVKLYTMQCDYPEIPFDRVNSAEAIAEDPHFQASDLVIFHFGIFSPLFELLPKVRSGTKRLVVFHNITAKEALGPEDHPMFDKSMAQMAKINLAHRVICVSETNLGVLHQAGIATPATVLPLAVRLKSPAPVVKPSFGDHTVRIVFVGRFVQAKGPHDLLAALAECTRARAEMNIRLDLVGNLAFSDAKLLVKLKLMAERLAKTTGGRLAITFHGDASEDVKQQLLQEADIFALPTYHEGFCVPIIEAMASGCKVVTYDNSNTPSISNGVAQLVPTGNVAEFARALGQAITQVLSDGWQNQGGYTAYVVAAAGHVAQFSPALVDKRFVDFIEGWVTNKEASRFSNMDRQSFSAAAQGIAPPAQIANPP